MPWHEILSNVDTYLVKRLDQAKLLTDPFKLKLLQRFGDRPVTTKQVADQMGEKAPRLYRHVDALVDAGLLELVEEKPKRGTVERYFRTVASRFEVDPTLFSPAEAPADEWIEMMRGLFRETEADLLRLFSRAVDSPRGKKELPKLFRVSVRGTDEEIGRLKAKLEEWVGECEALEDRDRDSGDCNTYTGLLTFYREPEDQDGNGA